VQLRDLLPGAIPDVLRAGMPMFGGAIVMILGALAVGSGYGWGTWKTVYTQGPSRAASFGGTLVTLAVMVAGLVLATVGSTSACPRWSRRRGRFGRAARPRRPRRLVRRRRADTRMWAAVGVLLGVLARGPALAVGLGLVWSLVVEKPPARRRERAAGDRGGHEPDAGLVGRLGGRALGGADVADGGRPGRAARAVRPVAAGLTAGYLVIFVAVALALVIRRDLL
jgi:hypothetical protein